MAQKNSFISLLEQLANLNKNATEIMTKMTDVVTSNKNSVIVTFQDEDGRTSQYEMPTVGWLKKEIDIANSNIKKLATLEGDNSVIIIDDNTSKKIKSVDLNREPDQIDNLNVVTTFGQGNNWFFESLMNPLLSVNIDLTGQIDSNVNRVLSRRYIVKFERDEDNVLTVNGLESLQTFEDTFLNKNDFTITAFQNWINNPTNLGVLNLEDENLYKDEQFFDLNYKEINFKGFFSVLKMERDSINNKTWYHLNSLDYFGRDGSTNTLSIGDILSVTKKGAFTKYKIIEINTSSSLFRVSLERIEGYDPIPIGNSVLEFYSTLIAQNNVKITIGFDEYNVIFSKPINTENQIIGSVWSKGMSFYSNDLVLETDSNVSMADFYLSNVYDYGTLLKDLVAKKIPSAFGTKPNSPEILSDNFKVVQINKHLTDTKDFKTLKKLHAQKNSMKSRLSQINDSITEKNKELNTKIFKSIAEKSRSQNELNTLIKKQESETKLYSSYVSQITNSRAEARAEPKFRIRGFWDVPDPILRDGYESQEVIGFEIQWRYGSKFGTENTTDGFEIKRSVVDFNALNSQRAQFTKKTGYFAKWVNLKTDVRKRSFDDTTKKWVWEIEDVSDADTPNINQLDIPIQISEKVEVRIRSISEVGYPETPLYSDWTDIITVEFPDNLNEVVGENEFIMKEATQEEMRVQFENELTSKGLTKHVTESFYVNEQYFGHTDKTVATSFKDAFGNTLSLFDYLKQMNDKINALEETIKRAKGELKITLFRGTDETEISNGAVINIAIQCEDYMIRNEETSTDYAIKQFYNNVYSIQDFYLQFENIANENDLGLLSDKTTTIIDSNSTITPNQQQPTFINNAGILTRQTNKQFIWLMPTAPNIGSLYSGTTIDTTSVFNTDYTNMGYGLGVSNPLLGTAAGPTGNWHDGTIVHGPIAPDTEPNSLIFGATIHPYLPESVSIPNTFVPSDANTNEFVDDSVSGIHIIEAQTTVKVPISIYFKPDMSKEDGEIESILTNSNPIVRKKAIRFLLEEESSSRITSFTIVFKLIRHKQFAQQQNLTSASNQIQI